MSFSLSRFRSSIHKQNVMHGNRYIVTIALPQLLRSRLGAQASNASGFTYAETATFRAQGAIFPGMNFASADGIPPRFGYGSPEGIPYGIIHDDITINFGLDDKGIIHKLFYEWMDLIVANKVFGQSSKRLSGFKATATRTSQGEGKGAYEVQYKDNYASDIDIYVLAPENNEVRYTQEYVMHVKMYRAYPKNIPQLNLSYEEKNNYLRFPVQFNYTDFVVNHKKLNGKTDIISKGV